MAKVHLRQSFQLKKQCIYKIVTHIILGLTECSSFIICKLTGPPPHIYLKFIHTHSLFTIGPLSYYVVCNCNGAHILCNFHSMTHTLICTHTHSLSIPHPLILAYTLTHIEMDSTVFTAPQTCVQLIPSSHSKLSSFHSSAFDYYLFYMLGNAALFEVYCEDPYSSSNHHDNEVWSTGAHPPKLPTGDSCSELEQADHEK